MGDSTSVTIPERASLLLDVRLREGRKGITANTECKFDVDVDSDSEFERGPIFDGQHVSECVMAGVSPSTLSDQR
jgi:hypothetical protein